MSRRRATVGLGRLYARIGDLETRKAPRHVRTSAELRRELLAIERRSIEPAWIAKYGQAPTDEEVAAHRPAFLRALATQAERTGRPDHAVELRRFAALVAARRGEHA